MKAWKILDIKAFMSQLFLGETFDFFLLCEAEIRTANQFQINGRLNRSWYDNDELEAIGDRKYSYWREIKAFCFQIIKGQKSPHSMKLVFALPQQRAEKVLERSGAAFLKEQVDGLFLNVRYERSELTVITGTSLTVFSADKTLEHQWDKEVAAFLKKCGLSCEEI